MKHLIILISLVGLSGCAYYTKLDVGGKSYTYSTSIGVSQKQNDAQ